MAQLSAMIPLGGAANMLVFPVPLSGNKARKPGAPTWIGEDFGPGMAHLKAIAKKFCAGGRSV
jgi:hypothetical protein